jgi:hypothetical protein
MENIDKVAFLKDENHKIKTFFGEIGVAKIKIQEELSKKLFFSKLLSGHVPWDDTKRC